MPKTFSIQKHTTVDKEFNIFGPDDNGLIVDYDDVNHPDVDRFVRKVVKILNQHWDD